MEAYTEQNGVVCYYATPEIKNIIREKLNQHLEENEILADDWNLFESGHIDSLTGVELVMDLETEFNIRLSDGDTMNITNNCSVNNIFLILTQYIRPSDK